MSTSDVTIEIKPGRYFIGIWFVGDGKKDWVCSVFRDPGEKRWHVRYRFRYYHEDHHKDMDPWDGKDRKSGYAFSGEGTEDETEKGTHQLAAFISGMFGKIRFLPLHSSDAAWNMEQLMLQDWAHGKMMTKDEAVKQGIWPGGDAGTKPL